MRKGPIFETEKVLKESEADINRQPYCITSETKVVHRTHVKVFYVGLEGHKSLADACA